MNFDEMDKKMRVYEESLDQVLLPELYMVACLDGNRFTRLTKEVCKFEAPFDIRFRDMMIETVKGLMTGSGFRLIYGYTESDEISLLFHPEDNTFSRKVRKLNTTLAGEASALFSLALGRAASFDCRIIPLPNLKLVADYFAWRQEDSHRNSLNAHCYWAMRREGMDKNAATDLLRSKSNAYKNELLFQRGINYNDLPAWQKRGVGLYFRAVEKEGFDPVTQKSVMAERKVLYTDTELPIGDAYRAFITDLAAGSRA